jgi:hypothetical protein
MQRLEARLNAHRELITELLAAWMAGEPPADLFQRLQEEMVAADYQEDPGALPDEAFAEENESAREIGAILDAARQRALAK